MDKLARLHWEAIRALDKDPKATETLAALKRFNEALDEQLNTLLPITKTEVSYVDNKQL